MEMEQEYPPLPKSRTFVIGSRKETIVGSLVAYW